MIFDPDFLVRLLQNVKLKRKKKNDVYNNNKVPQNNSLAGRANISL